MDFDPRRTAPRSMSESTPISLHGTFPHVFEKKKTYYGGYRHFECTVCHCTAVENELIPPWSAEPCYPQLRKAMEDAGWVYTTIGYLDDSAPAVWVKRLPSGARVYADWNKSSSDRPISVNLHDAAQEFAALARLLDGDAKSS